MFWYDVAHDREDQRAGNASKCPGERAGSYERVIGLGECAEKRSQSKPSIEGQQRALSVKTIEKKAGGDATDTGADSVGGNDDAKLSRRNREYPHVLRPQRHDNDEVDDGGEIDGRQRKQQQAFSERFEQGPSRCSIITQVRVS